MRIIITIVAIIFASFTSTATTYGFSESTVHADSAALDACADTTVGRGARFVASPIGQATITAVPIVGAGIALTRLDGRYRDYPCETVTTNTKKHDYYLQLLPAATLLSMKLAGVKSATPWGQMLTADAAAVALMVGSVQLIKHTTDVRRPDGSDNRSFPSGHTATAFMTATMLHHEYGARYPWLSVLGYATAAATGYLRIADNHHWVSDAVAGAGIGILSTELGYLVSDLIFHRPVLKDADYFAGDDCQRPSFVGFYVGANLPIASYRVDGRFNVKAQSGSSLGVEGAYYFNRYIGAGIKAGMSDLLFVVDDCLGQGQQIEALQTYGGVYLSLPVCSRFLIGAKALAGYSRFASVTAILPPDETVYNMPASGGFAASTGISLTFRLQKALSYRIYCDYESWAPLMGCPSRFSTLNVGAQLAITW